MGYIKKLKNNELVGGTDKTTIYPVTSTEAVFEEITEGSESNFKSQKFLNNNITGDRINEGTITDYNIATGTITKGKLSPQVQTMLDEGQKKALTPKGDYDSETEYEALDLVFDRDSNSSYVSLITPNTEPLTNEDAWEMFLDGTAVNTAQATINDKVDELDEQVDQAIEAARQELQDATDAANGAAELAMDVVANKVADAQIGYFECNTVTGTVLKQTTFDYIGTGNDKSYYTIPAAGSNVRIKMKYANTASGTIELQFGTNTATRKQLIYNGEPASDSNSWDAGEVLSIYYDPTYNNNVGAYQASNAMGGGSAVGKKKLIGAVGYLATNGSIIGSYNSNSDYRYIKYPVNPGDVVKISGKGATTPRLWAIADINENIISKAEANSNTTDLVLTMPAGAKWIVLNNHYSTYPDYEWYYAKAGSIGAHEMLTEGFLYGDLRTLAVGQVYKENEAVKTSDRQLFRVTKEVKAMNVADTVAIGDLKIYGTGANASTYKALKAVNVYNGTETEGLYAIGRPSLITITVDSSSLAIEEDTDISVTIGGITNTITVTAAASETKDADIAALIAAAFTNIEGWVLTDNSDGTLSLKCSTAGNNTISISSNTGETGLSITSSSVNGNTTLNQYNNGSWGDVTLAAFAEDYADIGVTDNTKMWQKLSIDDLVSLTTVQNTLVKTSKAESISYNNSQSGFATENVQEVIDELAYSSYIIPDIVDINSKYKINFIVNPNTFTWTTSNAGQHSTVFIIPEGVYKIKLTPTSNVMMWSLLKDYNSPVYGDSVQVASGLSTRYSANVETEVNNLSDAKFICVRADDTVTNAMCPIITFYYKDKTDIINNQVINNIKLTSDIIKTIFNSGSSISSSNLYGGYIEDSGKWYRATNSHTIHAAHYEYPVIEGEVYRIDAGPLDSVIYWLTAFVGNAENNTDVPITGSKITVKANTSSIIKVPADAAYMAVMYSYYTSIVNPLSVIKTNNNGVDLSDIIPSYIIENARAINLQSYAVFAGSFDGSGLWTTNRGKHIAIPVTEGEKYVIHGDGNSFWGWVTDSYSTPVTNGASVPYIQGYFRVYQKDAVAVTVPSGAAYLILCTVNGGGTSSKWNLYKVDSYRKRNTNELTKFKMATWNIGQFRYVDWNGSSTHAVPADQADAVALRFKQLINSIDADILGICEYSPSYSELNLDPRTVIFQCYKNGRIGHRDGANCNALFSNMLAFPTYEEKVFTATTTGRYYIHFTTRLFDENIHIIQAHLDHTPQTDRMAQIEELVSRMSGYRYVIVEGDFNTNNFETIESEVAVFTDAGFTPANGGYLGIYSTSHVGHPVDHIMVKGFAMSDIQISQDSDSLSDHMVLSCNLTMLNV